MISLSELLLRLIAVSYLGTTLVQCASEEPDEVQEAVGPGEQASEEKDYDDEESYDEDSDEESYDEDSEGEDGDYDASQLPETTLTDNSASEAGLTGVEDSPAVATESAQGEWRVWYVRDDTATAYQDTSAQSPAGVYEKGESLLLKVEGSWAMLQDGRYIRAEALSDKAVARNRKAGAWR